MAEKLEGALFVTGGTVVGAATSAPKNSNCKVQPSESQAAATDIETELVSLEVQPNCKLSFCSN